MLKIAWCFAPVAGASACASGGGEAFLYAFDVLTGFGFFQDGMTPPTEARRVSIGAGLPSNPRVTLGADPGDDKIYVKTSKGEMLTIDPPDRIDGGVSVIYWRQVF